MTIDIALHELYNKVADDPESTNEQIEAVNTLVDWINIQKKSYLENHKLFAKIYILYFGNLLNHYKDIEFAQKDLHKSLSDSVQNHAEWFRIIFNTLESEKYNKSIGLSAKHPALQTREEKEADLKIVQANQSEFLLHLNLWDSEKINESLSNQISEAINKFSHYD